MSSLQKEKDIVDWGTYSNKSDVMHISIIDDERILTEKISKKLQRNGYAVSAFYGYRDFINHGDAHSQLYIVDISLWDGTGFDIVRWLRKTHHSKVPIILISGYGDSQNIICGLDLWADDYLTKPFVPEELVARVRAVLRRPNSFIASSTVQFKHISFNTGTKKVQVAWKEIFLTKNERLMLETFLTHLREVISREKLISYVWGWGWNCVVSDNTINVTLSNLRRKLGSDFSLKTLYNQGYVLE